MANTASNLGNHPAVLAYAAMAGLYSTRYCGLKGCKGCSTCLAAYAALPALYPTKAHMLAAVATKCSPAYAMVAPKVANTTCATAVL